MWGDLGSHRPLSFTLNQVNWLNYQVKLETRERTGTKKSFHFAPVSLPSFPLPPCTLKDPLILPKSSAYLIPLFFFVCVAISYRKLLFILPHSTYCCSGKNCISKIFVFIPVLTVFPLWALQQKRVAEIMPDVLVFQHQSLTCPRFNG